MKQTIQQQINQLLMDYALSKNWNTSWARECTVNIRSNSTYWREARDVTHFHIEITRTNKDDEDWCTEIDIYFHGGTFYCFDGVFGFRAPELQLVNTLQDIITKEWSK